MRTCIVKVCVDLHHCTRQHWLWHFGFGAGPWIACTDVWSFHSLLCNSAKRHIQTLQSARLLIQRAAEEVGVIIAGPCSLLTLLTS